MKNRFDTVMDYIDANIHKDLDTIKKGIYEETGYNSLHFGKCFEILTGETLAHYINERKLYFAAQELFLSREKTICDISYELGYSEQSAFSRSMKTYFDCTPGEIRKGTRTIPDKKYRLSDLGNTKQDSKVAAIWNELSTEGVVSGSAVDFLLEVVDASKEYGFNIDTCYAIADVAERIEVPTHLLMRECFGLMIDIKSDPQYSISEDGICY